MHLQIEASGGEVEQLEQPDAISAYLHRLTDLAGMMPIAEPLIVQLPAGGLAGVLVLAESHASIHTVLGQAWIDLFSCRELPIDPVEIVQETQETFGFASIHYRMLKRGLETLPAPLRLTTVDTEKWP